MRSGFAAADFARGRRRAREARRSCCRWAVRARGAPASAPGAAGRGGTRRAPRGRGGAGEREWGL